MLIFLPFYLFSSYLLGPPCYLFNPSNALKLNLEPATHVKWKKPDLKRGHINDSIYMKVKNRQSYCGKNRTVVAFVTGSGTKGLGGGGGGVQGIEIFSILILVVVTRVYTSIKIHQIVPLCTFIVLCI